MPSIINRVGVVGDFGEETGGDLPEIETPIETKSTDDEIDEQTDAADKSKD